MSEEIINPNAFVEGEMTQEQTEVMEYLAEGANTITRESKYEKWRGNIVQNRPYFTQGNPELTGMTAYVICAGPSLEKNIDDLKTISDRGIIVCVDASLRSLLKRGIVPEYCVMIDGSEKMLTMMEGVDTSKTTLVCTPSASPEAVAAWQGPRYFVTTPHHGVEKKYNSFHLTRVIKAKTDLKAGDELYLDEQYEVEFGGVTGNILCGGNVSTAAHHFALVFLKVHQVAFVGLDLSWKYDNHHYADHEHQENYRDRTKTFPMGHQDINGEEVFTNFSLMAFKRWHEQNAKIFKGTVINATEGGILGVGEKGVKLDYIEFSTLKDTIAKYTPKKDLLAMPFSLNQPIEVNA